MLAAQGAEGVLLLRIGPRFGPVQCALRGGGDGGHGGAQRDVGAGLLQAVVLVAHIGRQAGVGVVPVQAGLQQVFLVVLVVDGRLALAMGGHHAQAGAVVRAKAAGHVRPWRSNCLLFTRPTSTWVSGWLGARLGSRLTVPPRPVPLGVTPVQEGRWRRAAPRHARTGRRRCTGGAAGRRGR